MRLRLMSTAAVQLDLAAYASEVAEAARTAARGLAVASGEQKNLWLGRSAELIRQNSEQVLQANGRDVAAAPGYGLAAAAIDRLKLTSARIAAAARALEEIALLADPIGEIIEGSVRPN